MTRKRKNYDDAALMYQSGSSIQAVAKLHGITRQAMHKILKRRGINFRSNLKYGEDNHFYNGGYEYDVRVRAVTQTAINNGKLIKGKCEICKKIKVEAHHDDYNKPLDVRWLCRKCHAYWHDNNRPIRRTIELPVMSRLDICSLGGKSKRGG